MGIALVLPGQASEPTIVVGVHTEAPDVAVIIVRAAVLAERHAGAFTACSSRIGPCFSAIRTTHALAVGQAACRHLGSWITWIPIDRTPVDEHAISMCGRDTGDHLFSDPVRETATALEGVVNEHAVLVGGTGPVTDRGVGIAERFLIRVGIAVRVTIGVAVAVAVSVCIAVAICIAVGVGVCVTVWALARRIICQAVDVIAIGITVVVVVHTVVAESDLVLRGLRSLAGLQRYMCSKGKNDGTNDERNFFRCRLHVLFTFFDGTPKSVASVTAGADELMSGHLGMRRTTGSRASSDVP